MLATIIIELGLLIYVTFRYKFSKVVKFTSFIIFCLAMFQISEFRTCGQTLNQAGLIWSRVGYVFITLLPPLGLHLISAIKGKKPGKLIWVADVLALAFVLIFGFAPSAINSAICGGNYVVFKLHANLGLLYGFYYFGLLFAGMIIAARALKTANKAKFDALVWMIIGYLVFLLPTGIVNMLDTSTTRGVPSIMCGFAVFYALILAFRVLPHATNKKN